MIKVPAFLLKRLYVKGSLQNNSEGFQFQMKNQLGSGYAKRLMPIALDGKEVPLEASIFTQGDQEIPLAAVSEGTPFTLAMNKTTTIKVKGDALAKGPHRIGMSFEVQGLGLLSLDFTDVVNDG